MTIISQFGILVKQRSLLLKRLALIPSFLKRVKEDQAYSGQ